MALTKEQQRKKHLKEKAKATWTKPLKIVRGNINIPTFK